MKKDNASGGMISDFKSNKPLFDQGECRGPMLSSIGQRLRDFYAQDGTDEMPSRLEFLMQKLVEAQRN